MLGRSTRARGEDEQAPALTDNQQRALDAIRRQLDAEFGEGEHPGRSLSPDVRRRERPGLRHARPGPTWGLLGVLAAFALGGAIGTVGTALYLTAFAPVAPARGGAASLTSVDAAAHEAGQPASPKTARAPSSPVPVAPPPRVEPPPVAAAPERATAGQPASDPEETAPAAAISAAGPDPSEARKDRQPAGRRAGSLALPPRPARPVPARPRPPADSRARDIQSR